MARRRSHLPALYSPPLPEAPPVHFARLRMERQLFSKGVVHDVTPEAGIRISIRYPRPAPFAGEKAPRAGGRRSTSLRQADRGYRLWTTAR